jgi:hypothetical protein
MPSTRWCDGVMLDVDLERDASAHERPARRQQEIIGPCGSRSPGGASKAEVSSRVTERPIG